MAQCPIGQTEALSHWPCSRAEGSKRSRGQSGEQGDQVLRWEQNGTMSLACWLQRKKNRGSIQMGDQGDQGGQTSHPGNTGNTMTFRKSMSWEACQIQGMWNQEPSRQDSGFYPLFTCYKYWTLWKYFSEEKMMIMTMMLIRTHLSLGVNALPLGSQLLPSWLSSFRLSQVM